MKTENFILVWWLHSKLCLVNQPIKLANFAIYGEVKYIFITFAFYAVTIVCSLHNRNLDGGLPRPKELIWPLPAVSWNIGLLILLQEIEIEALQTVILFDNWNMQRNVTGSLTLLDKFTVRNPCLSFKYSNFP
jgi:hypothetical protein